MQLYLQFGYGMMEHCRDLLSRWGGGTVILSPRDLSPRQLPGFASSLNAIQGGRVLLDPQFYLPHADHERLCSHTFWPGCYETGSFWQGDGPRSLLEELGRLNQQLACERLILPGILASVVDDDWLETQRIVLTEARGLALGRPLVATIALSDEAVRDQSQVARVIEQAEEIKADGYYLILEHPRGNCLVEDAIWIGNTLDLAAGLKLFGSQVIIGYCNQQMLVAGIAGVDAIASGTWMNVRSFPPEKFRSAGEEEIRQRARWYYCPQALSEYRVTYLDLAYRHGLLDTMSPAPELDGGYVTRLLTSGTLPSNIGLEEPDAFRHYLYALHGQASQIVAGTFDETVSNCQRTLDSAEALLTDLHAVRITGEHRDFAGVVDVNRGALALLDSIRGPMLRRNWANLL